MMRQIKTCLEACLKADASEGFRGTCGRLERGRQPEAQVHSPIQKYLW